MKDLKDRCRVAVVQATPVMFDKAACLDKALALIRQAGQAGAELVVFPELFLPGYPYGMSFGFTVGRREESGRRDWKRYYDNSVLVPGPETRRLGQAAREAGVWLSIGLSERTEKSATLFNSNLIFSPEGTIAAHHRKLKPTGAERVVWGDGDRGPSPAADTPWGPVGSLICWESYMPLARVALYQQGVTLYLSPNTNDNDEWQQTIRHIAIEGHCYFINCDMVFTRDDYPRDLEAQEEIARLPWQTCRGGSCVIDPYGHYVTEPLWDREGIVYADLDIQQVPASRMEFDACGHYSRPDVLPFRPREHITGKENT